MIEPVTTLDSVAGDSAARGHPVGRLASRVIVANVIAAATSIAASAPTPIT